MNGSRLWREVKPTWDASFAQISMCIQCAECDLEIDELAALNAWRYFHDGTGELVPYCPDCAAREFDPVT